MGALPGLLYPDTLATARLSEARTGVYWVIVAYVSVISAIGFPRINGPVLEINDCSHNNVPTIELVLLLDSCTVVYSWLACRFA